MRKHIAWISLASTLLLACDNPAPLDDAADAAGAPAALDQLNGPCQLPERSSAPSPERSRELYAARDADPTTSKTAYTGSKLPCAESLAGSYGMRVELDVYVQDAASSSEHDPGRGRASLLLRADIARARDDAADVALQLCGLELPARYGYASSGVTQLQLPDEIWDRPSMPRWNSRIHADRQTAGALQLDAFPVLLGIALNEPGADWPSFDQTPELDCGAGAIGKACFPDHDGDGEPGISFHTQREGEVDDAPYPACANWHFAAPSTDGHAWSSGTSTEARRIFIGLRTALRLFPSFDPACTQATGRAQAADIMTRAFECELTGGQRCSARQSTVIDERAPSYHVLEQGETPPDTFRDSRAFVDEALDRSPSTGGKVTLRRLQDAADNCEAVRATLAQDEHL